MLASLFVFWRTPLAFYGTISSSKRGLSSFWPESAGIDRVSLQLRLQEGDRVCWSEEPRRDMLHELPSAVFLLHKVLQEGVYGVMRLITILAKHTSRRYTKFPRKKITPRRACHLHFSVSSTTYRRQTSLSVSGFSKSARSIDIELAPQRYHGIDEIVRVEVVGFIPPA